MGSHQPSGYRVPPHTGSQRRAPSLGAVIAVGLAIIACSAVPGLAVKPTATPTATAPAAITPVPTDTFAPAVAAPTEAAPTEPVPTTLAPTTSAPTQPLPVLSSDQVLAARQAAWEAYAAYVAAGPIRVTQTTSQNNAVVSTITTALVPPDQFHDKVEYMGQVASERYVYGGHLYARYPASGKDTWTRSPGSTLKQFADSFGALSEGAGVTPSDGQVVGVEEVNGERAVVYGYTTQQAGGAKVANKLWVSQSKGLPLRYAKDLPQGAQLVQDYSYDPKLIITLPPEVAAAPTAKP